MSNKTIRGSPCAVKRLRKKAEARRNHQRAVRVIKVHVGIDPGLRGGIVSVLDGRIWTCNVMPISLKATRVLLDSIMMRSTVAGHNVRVTLEEVNCGATKGRKSAFTFGRGFGGLEGLLEGCNFQYQMVDSPRWMRTMCSTIQKQPTTKARCLIAANLLQPNYSFIPKGCRKVHDGIVDAYLLAEYGRRTFE